MFRPFDSTIPDYEANWEFDDPVIPFGIVAVSIDTSNTKTGDGVKKWSELSYTSGSIGNKNTETRSPVDNEIIYFEEFTNEWMYRLQGVYDTTTNWESVNTVFPTFTLLLEVNDTTEAPTGRFKVGDGFTSYQSLPWSGMPIDVTTFPIGYGIEFNGTYFEPKQFLEVNELPIADSPTGAMFARDDGQWATPGDDSIASIPVAVNNNLIAFDGIDGKHVKDTGIDYTTIISQTGTPNESFQIHSGVKLYDVNGELHIKDSTDAYGNIRADAIYAEFGTFIAINVGGFSTESTSATLTSDGTYIYVDGGKVIDVNHDGHGSELDADTLDTFHASSFATLGYVDTSFPTVPASTISGNFVTFTSTDGLTLGDSGYNFSSFPTIHNNLGLLQGGTTDEYYHLDADTFASVGTMTTTTYCRWRGSSATDPTDPVGGDIYYKTGDSKTYIYNGTTWDMLN